MNTYMVHMLLRAREVHRLNYGETGRDSLIKCPFCIADEDEQWFKFKFEYRHHPEVSLAERPKRMPAPHCKDCPLLSVTNGTVTDLMNDCVEMGKSILDVYEGDTCDVESI